MRLYSALFVISGALACKGDSSSRPPASDAALIDSGGDAAPATLTLDPEISTMSNHADADRITTTIKTLAGFGTRNSCSDASNTTQGIGAARDWIQAQMSAIGGLQVQLNPYDQTGCGATALPRHNVVGYLPSTTHPERLIVIGGHYDSRTVNVADGTSPAPGANDSGSQTSVVLEVARAMAGSSFDASLVFVAFGGEEQGLVGSASLAKNIGTVFAGAKVEAMINCDIVGGDSTSNGAASLQQFRIYSPGTPREIASGDGTPDDTSPSRGLMRYVGTWGAAYVPDMAMIPKLREDRPGRGGDHESFIDQGIPGVRFIEPVEALPHQHTSNDLFAYVTPAYTSRVAKVVIAVGASLARAPSAPSAFVASASALTWTAPAYGKVDHYVVAARAVTENFYRRRVIASATSMTAEPSDLGLDPGAAYFVSVAAVDAAGHESLFAYPEYRCDSTGCVVPPDAMNITAKN